MGPILINSNQALLKVEKTFSTFCQAKARYAQNEKKTNNKTVMICTVHRRTKRHYSKREREKKSTDKLMSFRSTVSLHSFLCKQRCPISSMFPLYTFMLFVCWSLMLGLSCATHVHLGKCCLHVYIYIQSTYQNVHYFWVSVQLFMDIYICKFFYLLRPVSMEFRSRKRKDARTMQGRIPRCVA